MALTTTAAGHGPDCPAALSSALRYATERNGDLEDLVLREEELVRSLEANLQLHKDILQLQEEQLEGKERCIAALQIKVEESDKVITAQQKLAKSNNKHIQLLERLCEANKNYASSLENVISVLYRTQEERVQKLVNKIDALNKDREHQGILAKRRQSLLDNTKAKLRSIQKGFREARALRLEDSTRTGKLGGMKTVLRSKSKGGRGAHKNAQKRART